jgi:hypothetical protein
MAHITMAIESATQSAHFGPDGSAELADENAHFTDLGADHFTKHSNSEAKKHNHIRNPATRANFK